MNANNKVMTNESEVKSKTKVDTKGDTRKLITLPYLHKILY
jgi:hypothetical protein